MGKAKTDKLSHRLIGVRSAGKYSSLLMLFIWLFLGLSASAITLISQGFLSSGDLADGTLVSLPNNSTDRVVAANLGNVGNLFGVVIGSDNSEVSLSSSGANQVQVATSSVESVLVSDINGSIASGDPITASPIDGVGMKATNSVKVVGIAQENFPNSTATKTTYSDKSNQKHNVQLGQVPVLINVAYYYKTPAKTIIPTAIQNIANALAGKTVSPLPIIISVVIFIVVLIVVASIVYSMIHSSIISVGRNPLSQAAISRNVLYLSALVVGILAVGVVAIYMILTKL